MILIKILTENGEREWPIFDSTLWQASYDAGAVYLIDDHLDGKLVARDRDYGLIGVVQMTDAEFKNRILPLVFCTTPPFRCDAGRRANISAAKRRSRA
jgi:hypothetical protein